MKIALNFLYYMNIMQYIILATLILSSFSRKLVISTDFENYICASPIYHSQTLKSWCMMKYAHQFVVVPFKRKKSLLCICKIVLTQKSIPKYCSFHYETITKDLNFLCLSLCCVYYQNIISKAFFKKQHKLKTYFACNHQSFLKIMQKMCQKLMFSNGLKIRPFLYADTDSCIKLLLLL